MPAACRSFTIYNVTSNSLTPSLTLTILLEAYPINLYPYLFLMPTGSVLIVTGTDHPCSCFMFPSGSCACKVTGSKLGFEGCTAAPDSHAVKMCKVIVKFLAWHHTCAQVASHSLKRAADVSAGIYMVSTAAGIYSRWYLLASIDKT